MHKCVWIKTLKGDRGMQHYCIKNEQRSGEPSLTFSVLEGILVSWLARSLMSCVWKETDVITLSGFEYSSHKNIGGFTVCPSWLSWQAWDTERVNKWRGNKLDKESHIKTNNITLIEKCNIDLYWLRGKSRSTAKTSANWYGLAQYAFFLTFWHVIRFLQLWALSQSLDVFSVT